MTLILKLTEMTWNSHELHNPSNHVNNYSLADDDIVFTWRHFGRLIVNNVSHCQKVDMFSLNSHV